MTLLPVLTYPDPRLKRKSLPVDVECGLTTDETQFVSDMLETMYHHNGVGLAAPQVDVLKRIIVIDVKEYDVIDNSDDAKDKTHKPWILINPVIVASSTDLTPSKEGCLSVPGFNEFVDRPTTVTVRYHALHAQAESEIQEATVTGIHAIAVCHEIDHLDGVLYIDHLSRLKRGMLDKKMKKSRGCR